MVSLKMVVGLLSIFVPLALLPVTTATIVPHSCCYGQDYFDHGEVIVSFPTKCMQLYCDHGMNVPRYFDTPQDCGCCEYNGKIYRDGEKIEGVCIEITCHYGYWRTSGKLDDCCSKCNLKNDPHITTFDGNYFDWHGTCNYSISQLGFDYMPSFGIFGGFRQCNTLSSCIDVTTFVDNIATTIEIGYADGADVLVNGVPYEVQSDIHLIDGKVLAWRSDDDGCNFFLGSQGYLLMTCPNQLNVWAFPSLMNRVNGLCGHYSMYAPNDFTGRDMFVYPVEKFPYVFPRSWTNPSGGAGGECAMWSPDDIVNAMPVQDPCQASEELRGEYHMTCTNLLEDVEYNGHTGSHFLIYTSVEACVSDICIMIQEGGTAEEVQAKKYTMVEMLRVNIKCEVMTESDESESESESESEHSMCSETGGCGHKTHFKANFNFEIEFGGGGGTFNHHGMGNY